MKISRIFSNTSLKNTGIQIVTRNKESLIFGLTQYNKVAFKLGHFPSPINSLLLLIISLLSIMDPNFVLRTRLWLRTLWKSTRFQFPENFELLYTLWHLWGQTISNYRSVSPSSVFIHASTVVASDCMSLPLMRRTKERRLQNLGRTVVSIVWEFWVLVSTTLYVTVLLYESTTWLCGAWLNLNVLVSNKWELSH